MEFWFILIAAYVIDGLIFGLITQYLAESKGYDGGFWWGFWLGLISLLVVGFRPNKNYYHSENARNENRY